MVKHDTVEKAMSHGGTNGPYKQGTQHKVPLIFGNQVTWCEIDGDVVEAAKKYMPNVAIAVSTWAAMAFARLCLAMSYLHP